MMNLLAHTNLFFKNAASGEVSHSSKYIIKKDTRATQLCDEESADFVTVLQISVFWIRSFRWPAYIALSKS